MGGSEFGRTAPVNRDIEQDERYLIWFSGNEEKSLKINSITKITRGQVNFQQQARSENFCQSFSLVYRNGEKSLDLICKDNERAESWYLGLKSLISGSNHGKAPSLLRNSGGAHSYSNSPISYTQRKHIPELLEGSAILSQDIGPPLKVHRSTVLTKKCSSDGLLLSPNIYSLPEQAYLSDKGSIIDLALPLSHLTKSGRRAEKTMESVNSEGHRVSSSSIISSSSNGCLLDDHDSLNDILLWGEGIEGFILGGKIDQSSGQQTDCLLPKLLESAIALDVSSISCGEKHAALITKRGEVFCWGKENGGRLGHKINVDVTCPKIVEALSSVKVEVAKCGESHTCALSRTGEVYIWGGSTQGFDTLADGSIKSLWLPHRISLEGIQISSIACGAWHTALISSSGAVFTFGEGIFGALGHGNLESICQPRQVESLNGFKVKSVACGQWHTAAIVEIPNKFSDGNSPGCKLFTWGDGDKGKLGHANKERKLVPTIVASLAENDFLQVSCGQMMTIALTVSGTVFTMGSSMHGQLGNPHAKDGAISIVEGALKCEHVKEISSGSCHVAVLTSKGNVYTWGKGANGRLGLGDVEDRNCPALVEGLKDRHVRSVTCGSSFTAVICRHKAISSTDQSLCSGCKMVFGFTRKKHHCYNCGFTFCHACSSKKTMNASLAPNKSKHYRVCDQCFAQLRSLEEFSAGQETPSSRHLSMMHKLAISNLKHLKSEPAYMVSQALSPKLGGHEQLKYYEGKNFRQGRGMQLSNSFAPFSLEPQRWGQVECPRHFTTFNSATSNVHSKNEALSVFPMRAPEGKLPAANTSIRGFEDKKVTQSTAELVEEIQRLRVEAKNLEEQCKMKEEKIQHYKEGIKETWTLASEEVAKCKAAKDVIKVLAARLKEMSEKFATEKQEIVVKKILAPKESQELEDAQVLEDNLHTSSTQNGSCSPIESSNGSLIVGREKFMHHTLLSDMKSESRDLSQNPGNMLKTEDGHPPFSEWVEQDEPGVYITFMALPNGQKELKRVRFSRKRFSEKEAETWWAENRLRVHYKYNVIGTVNT
ncbi:Ultraviolet-B receptor [Nymphaea thermarum]|nr:Ultraviolet-B receptor [Nymphaea thermarum]